eukprot:8361351-Pyramimonas_sp.AAC.1
MCKIEVPTRVCHSRHRSAHAGIEHSPRARCLPGAGAPEQHQANSLAIAGPMRCATQLAALAITEAIRLGTD